MNNSDDTGELFYQFILNILTLLILFWNLLGKILPTSVEFAESSEVASLREKFCDFSLQIDLYQSTAIHWKIVISYKTSNIYVDCRQTNWL